MSIGSRPTVWMTTRRGFDVRLYCTRCFHCCSCKTSTFPNDDINNMVTCQALNSSFPQILSSIVLLFHHRTDSTDSAVFYLLMSAVYIFQKMSTSNGFLIAKNKPKTEYNYLQCVNAFWQHFTASLVIQTTVQSVTTRITNF